MSAYLDLRRRHARRSGLCQQLSTQSVSPLTTAARQHHCHTDGDHVRGGRLRRCVEARRRMISRAASYGAYARRIAADLLSVYL